MAAELMLGLNQEAERGGLDPIADGDMEKIMWKNTAGLWKIEVWVSAKPPHDD